MASHFGEDFEDADSDLVFSGQKNRHLELSPPGIQGWFHFRQPPRASPAGARGSLDAVHPPDLIRGCGALWSRSEGAVALAVLLRKTLGAAVPWGWL